MSRLCVFPNDQLSAYYKKGYRTAKRRVRLFTPTADTFNNTKPFLDRIYKEAVGGIAVPIEENMVFLLNNILEWLCCINNI